MTPDIKNPALLSPDKPVASGRYIHAKTGNFYTILHVGIYCGTNNLDRPPYDCQECGGFPEGTALVVYVGNYNNPRGNFVYVRPSNEWFEKVTLADGSVLPRYYPVVD